LGNIVVHPFTMTHSHYNIHNELPLYNNINYTTASLTYTPVY